MTTPPRSPGAEPGAGAQPSGGRPPGRRHPRPAAGNRRRRDRPRWGLRLAAFASAIVLTAAGAGHAVVGGLESAIDRVDPFTGLADRPQKAGEALNFLVVGTDGRDRITADQRAKYHLGGAPCNCTDTIMLVHLSADRQRASVVSIPRDSYAELPGAGADGGEGGGPEGGGSKPQPIKINAAYSRGGPRLTVSTVEHMTGVRIDHYLEVDFTSFMNTVDVLGGVDVCTAKPLKDSHSGLDLPAGTSRLNGGEALGYVRARHLDGAGDLGRMQRQQRFLAALVDRVTDSGVLLSPAKFNDLASALLDSVRADRAFGTEEMLGLGKAMRGFTAASSEFASVPISDPSHQVPGIGSTVKWDEDGAEELFDALREDRPLTGWIGQAGPDGPRSDGRGSDGRTDDPSGKAPKKPSEKSEKPEKPSGKSATLVEVPPGQVRVRVENGTDTTGLGERTSRALRSAGFLTVGVPGNAERPVTGPAVVTYDPDWDRSARTVAAALPGAELKAVEGHGPVIEVTVGPDFTEVQPVRAEAPARPDGGTGAVRGDDVVCGRPGEGRAREAARR